MARGIGGTARKPARHTTHLPSSRVSVIVNGSRLPTSGASDSLEIPVTPLWVMATETLTSGSV